MAITPWSLAPSWLCGRDGSGSESAAGSRLGQNLFWVLTLAFLDTSQTHTQLPSCKWRVGVWTHLTQQCCFSMEIPIPSDPGAGVGNDPGP